MKNSSIELIVEKSNEKIFNSNIQAIHSFIANHENIPSKLVNEFLELIEYKNNFELQKQRELAKKNTKSLIDFFIKYPDYKFQCRFKNLNHFNLSHHNFEYFIQIMLCSYYQFESDRNEKCSKDSTILYFYNAFTEEVIIDKKESKNKFTEYKKAVLAGAFTIAAGRRINSKKYPKPKEIYLAVYHAIKKRKETSS
jgi:hypothetical protein